MSSRVPVKSFEHNKQKFLSPLNLESPAIQLPSVGQVNQTIIINNPNININYGLNPNSSKGLDSWNLNQNLKDFSETRQLGFYQPKTERGREGAISQRNKHNSPYIIHKVRTQELRGVNKVFGETKEQFSTLKQHGNNPRSTFNLNGQNRTISHHQAHEVIRKDVLPAVDKVESSVKKILGDHVEKSEKKFHLKKVKHMESDKKIDIMTLTYHNNLEEDQGEDYGNRKIKQKQIRQNKFERVLAPQTQKVIPINNTYQSDESLQQQREEDIQLLIKQQEYADVVTVQAKITPKDSHKMQSYEKRLAMETRRREFVRAIEQVSKNFLKDSDQYFSMIYNCQIPQSKIEYYITNMNQPECSQKEQQSQIGMDWGNFDFAFEEEKKINSKKSPKRKRMYENAD